MQNYDEKELKYAIYQHIKKNKYASLADLTTALNFHEDMVVMNFLEELRKERYLNQLPFSIGDTNDSSARYMVTNKKYNSEL